MPRSDAKWFAALRLVANRAIDALELAAATDTELAEAFAVLLGRGAGSGDDAGLQHDEAQAAISEATLAPSPEAPATAAMPAAPLVARELKIGDAPVGFIVRAREEPAGAEPLPAIVARLSALGTGAKVILPAPAWPREPATAEEFDGERLASHLRLKARASRWQQERSALLDAGEDVHDGDQALRDEAARQSCFLWMIKPDRWRERSPRAFELVAGCYDALGDAVELMALADRVAQQQAEAMRLLAEASSALRAVLEEHASAARDRDQEVVFRWLDRETDVRSIFVERHMRLDDPAVPENHAELRRRIAALREPLDQFGRARRARQNLFGKASYAMKKLQEATPDGAPFDPENPNFRSLAQATAALLEDGVPASDRRFRDLFAPVLGRMPQDVGPELTRVLQEADAYLDRLGADGAGDNGEEIPADAGDALLEEARLLTRGRHAVLIGGIPQEQHRRRLEQDLALASLNWLRVDHGESFDSAAVPALRDERVSLAMVMTRFRSHRDGPEARRICRERGIPLVELPAGYGSRQVAHQIIRQASQQLASIGTG